jgi:hypothetical protein
MPLAQVWTHWGLNIDSFFFFFPFFPLVPNVFPTGSCHVPMRFPKFPIAPQFYPIWFAQSSTLVNMNWNSRLKGSTFVSILQLGSKELLILRSVPNNVHKNWWWANDVGSFTKKIKMKSVSDPWTNYYESNYELSNYELGLCKVKPNYQLSIIKLWIRFV